MRRNDLLKLSASSEMRQREIARRLKNGLPLAGMLAAAALGGGCDESAEKPVVPEPSVVRKVKTPPPEPSPNRDNGEPGFRLVGAPQSGNRKNETGKPLTPGRARVK